MATMNTYMLSHQDEETRESERLERQYKLLKYAFSGRLLHPSIPPLGEHFAVADIGTGTGAWLNDLARSYPRSADSRVRLVGFDISSHKNPSVNAERVDLVVHDITRRFPAEYHGIFDIVHLRLLVYAIREDNIIEMVKNVTELLRPGGYLQWQDTDLNEIWATPASPIISQAIKAVNLERIARELSLFMPDTIVKALLTLQIPTQTPILDLPSCSRNVLRILAMETISTAEINLPPELEKPKQDLTFEVLLILLHAATRRKQSGQSIAVTPQQKETDTQERKQEEEYGRLEEKLKQIHVEGSHRLNTKFTWVVAKKTLYHIDQGW